MISTLCNATKKTRFIWEIHFNRTNNLKASEIGYMVAAHGGVAVINDSCIL
jgi:hypothetical protein